MKLKWYGKQVEELLMQAQNLAMAEACKFLTAEVKGSMQPGTGEFWRSRRPGGGWHQASEAPLPPAPDTEELKNSISWATSNGSSGGNESSNKGMVPPIPMFNKIEGKVGTTNLKGLWHELGLVPNGVERPFLRPGLANNKAKILEILSKGKI